MKSSNRKESSSKEQVLSVEEYVKKILQKVDENNNKEFQAGRPPQPHYSSAKGGIFSPCKKMAADKIVIGFAVPPVMRK